LEEMACTPASVEIIVLILRDEFGVVGLPTKK
jgi:hypothetical protein